MAFQLENIHKSKVSNSRAIPTPSFLRTEINLFNSGFSNKSKEDLYVELSVLLKAGINLKEALELIKDSQKKKKDKVSLHQILEDIVSGTSLSEAIHKKKKFTDYEYYSIKIGEETGSLQRVAEQLGAFFARKNEQRRTLISALTYPAIIMVTAILVVVFMLQFVVPMFQDIFEQQKVELPVITKFIISCSVFIQDYGLLVLFLISLTYILYIFFQKDSRIRKLKDAIIAKVPFLGSFVSIIYLSQFTQAVKLLTASKIPVVHSIKLVKKMISYTPLQAALIDVEEDLMKGEQLSKALSCHKIFDAKMVALVKVAEETNQNEYIFERLNIRYNIIVEQKSKLLTTILEPIIILFVGIMVGIILIAMYLPMFRLSSVMG